MFPSPLTITVDGVHTRLQRPAGRWPRVQPMQVREAERRAANGNRAVTPALATLAHVEQSRYASGRLTEDAVVFIDFDGRQVTCLCELPRPSAPTSRG